MEDQQHEDAPPANNRAVKLPPFWTANPRAWFASARADLFAAHNSKQAHDVVAAVAAVSLSDQEGEETTVAAVRPGAGGGGQRGGGWKAKKK